MLILCFFVVQHHTRGWYLFPEHTSYIEHTWNGFWYKFRMGRLHIAVYDNLRFYYYLLLMALAVTAAIKTRKPAYAALLLPAIIIYYYVNDMRAGRPMPSVPFFILFLAAVSYFLYVMSRKSMFAYAHQRKFVVCTVVFVLACLCFSAFNFITYRYMITAIMPLLVIAAVLMDLFIDRSFKWLYYPALSLILLISFCSFNSNKGHGDTDPGAYKAMRLQQDVMGYLEQHDAYDHYVCAYSSLARVHLTDPSTCFLHGARRFGHVSYELNGHTEYVVFDNLEPDGHYEAIAKDSSFTLVYRKERRNDIWAAIYKKKGTM